MNKVILCGNVGRDVEIRTTQSGDKVANFPLATSEKWKDRDGNRQERTEWSRIVVWGKLADVCERYVKKGSKLLIEGQLQTRKWQDQSGQDRFTTEVVLRGFGGTLQMLDGPPRDSNAQGDYAAQAASQGAQQQAGDGQDLDDDIPF